MDRSDLPYYKEYLNKVHKVKPKFKKCFEIKCPLCGVLNTYDEDVIREDNRAYVGCVTCRKLYEVELVEKEYKPFLWREGKTIITRGPDRIVMLDKNGEEITEELIVYEEE